MKDPRGQSRADVIVISVDQGGRGGAEVALKRLLGQLVDRASAPAITLACPSGSALREFCRNTPIRWLDWSARADTYLQNTRAFLGLHRAIRRFPLRLGFGWGARTFEWTALMGALLQTPIQGRIADHPQAFYHGATRRRILRIAAHRFGGCVAPSQALAQVCRSAGWRVPVHVIYNHVDPMPRRNQSRDAAVEVGFLGGTSWLKGVDLVMDWARSLRSAPVRWHFFGQQHDSDRRWAEQLKALSLPNLVLHGHRPSNTIYPMIDVVVHPSRCFDCSPNVLLEAASAGVPVIASDVGGSRELMEPGRTGFLYDPDRPDQGREALAGLVADQGLRQDLAEKAADFYRDFVSRRDPIAAYLAFWQQGMDRTPPDAAAAETR